MSTHFVPRPSTPPVNLRDFERKWVPAAQTAAGELVGINESGIVLPAGSPVHRIANDGLRRASAGAGLVLRCVGLTVAASQPNAPIRYVFNGQLSLADWTLITGTTLLTVDATYYLGAVAGTLATAFPALPASALLQLVGTAVDAYTLDITPDVYEVDL